MVFLCVFAALRDNSPTVNSLLRIKMNFTKSFFVNDCSLKLAKCDFVYIQQADNIYYFQKSPNVENINFPEGDFCLTFRS